MPPWDATIATLVANQHTWRIFKKNLGKVLATNLDTSVNTKGKPIYLSNIGTY